MYYLKAIQLLSPYHNAKLFCVNPDSSPQFPTGQLSTGNELIPSIAVDNGIVIPDDLYTILELYTEWHLQAA